MLKSFLDWLLKSSADPAKLSLTIKGGLLAILPVIMILTGIDEGSSNYFVDAIADIVFYGLSLVSAVGVVYGFGRKLYNTFVFKS